MEFEEVATGAYRSLRLIAFVLRTFGAFLMVPAVLILVYARDVSGVSTFLVDAIGVGSFFLGLIVTAFGECISVMIDLARNLAITAEASVESSRLLSQMMGGARPGERREPRLY